MTSKFQPTLLEVVLLVLGATSGLLFVAYPASPLVLRVYLKIVPIALMAVWILSRTLDRSNAAIFVGLVLALLGDATLEVGGDLLFVVGIGFNVAALVSYTVYFVQSDRSWDLWRLLPPLVVLGGIYAFLYPGLGTFRIPVAVYCLVYIVFLWRSSARIGDPTIGVASQWVCFLGCVVITVSDALLSLQIFSPSQAWYASPLVSMTLWWTGQLMMTITAEIREKKRRLAR